MAAANPAAVMARRRVLANILMGFSGMDGWMDGRFLCGSWKIGFVGVLVREKMIRV